MQPTFPGDRFIDIFHYSQAPMLIIGTDIPVYTMLDVNEAYLNATHTTRNELVGRSVFDVFPANPTDEVSQNIERTRFSFEQAIKNKAVHTMYNYRYDIPIPGTNNFEERYWTTSNTPVLNETGEVEYFIHSPADITATHKLAERERKGLLTLKEQEQKLYNIFMQAPVGIAIFKGPQYIVDLINPPLCALYGKTMEQMIGRPVFDVLSHSKGLGFEELLDKVRLTGEPFKGNALPVPLERDGKLETVFTNFVYEPFRESDGDITGVIAIATEVTELVHAKKQVEEAESRARLAVDAVGLGTYDLNLVTGEMITSKKFAHIFGFEEPVPRQSYIDVFHAGDLQLRLEAHEQAITNGNLMYEARVLWKDGTTHWVRVEGKVYYNEQGEAVRILGILLDITGQRKALEDQRKLVSLVENSVDLMSILNFNGVTTYINNTGRNLLGLDAETPLNTIPASALYGNGKFPEIEMDVVSTVMQQGKWSGTLQVQNLKTNESVPVYNNCFRIDDPLSAQPIAIGAVMRDLRPELEAKKALEENEQLLRNITTATPTALWMSDEQGGVTYVNQTWIDWTGNSYEANLGPGWLQQVFEEDKERVIQKLKKAIADKTVYEAEFRLNNADGTMHWCIASGKPQYRSDGSFIGYIGACIDITEQKQLQQQKDDFIGIASHELKTPVTSIKGYAQVLEKILLKKGDVKEAAMMQRMDAQVNRLTSLISDLLDVTKINSGKLQFNDAEFDFNDMVAELIEDLQRTTEKHKLIADFKPAGIVFGDKERIGQVITNLVTNAIKYSPDSNDIIIHTSLENSEVTLCVEDYGIGIAADKLQKVFEQFYRVSGDKQHTFPGLGLGLYISSEIIKREGGRIWVNSTVGKGTSFCFALPVKK